MSVHAIAIPVGTSPSAGCEVVVEGDEAHHAARVKRCEAGDAVTLCDGAGLRASGEIAAIEKSGKGAWRVVVRVGSGVAREAPPAPWLRVVGAAPKGERLDDMIDALGQVGVAAWSPVRCERSVVDPRAHKLERLGRVCMETVKQCGRAWALRVEGATEFGDALGGGAAGNGSPARVIVADASGEAFGREMARGGGAGEHAGEGEGDMPERITLLVGPEGGFSAGELALARERGAAIARFGGHVMRIEVAAVVAAAMVLGA